MGASHCSHGVQFEGDGILNRQIEGVLAYDDAIVHHHGSAVVMPQLILHRTACVPECLRQLSPGTQAGGAGTNRSGVCYPERHGERAE